MKTIAFTNLLLLAILVRGSEERPEEFYDPDVQRLIHAPSLAFGGVGIAGRISEGEAAFGAIVRKKESIRFFIAAFEYGNAPARCYALIALRELSPELFRESIARVRKKPADEDYDDEWLRYVEGKARDGLQCDRSRKLCGALQASCEGKG